jgi:hypothetical protein
MLIRLTPTNTNDGPIDIEVDIGLPVVPNARHCLHPMAYRLVRTYDLLKIDPEGVAINVCDYCGVDLNNEHGR